MRTAVCAALMALYQQDPFVFLTGDLGFQALEPLRTLMGERFINAGIAEQNMVSVAAGMAQQGMAVWIYSIAPFCYARPFEQIRNDICHHGLPVRLIGNGGGYGYGAMGPSHHALEDYGVLLTLPHIRAYVPIFAQDVGAVVQRMAAESTPGYLRLGRCERPDGYVVPPYAPWRLLLPGGGQPVVVVGPLAGGLLAALASVAEEWRPAVWGVSELPLTCHPPPESFLAAVRASRRLVVLEEHVVQGGVGQMLAHLLVQQGIAVDAFVHRHALGYLSGTCGSQSFHRRECGLDPGSLLHLLGVV
ncbi:MAG: transketolase [Magnetococcales bacterium]|nr:transketolase [Magnetococcales bacterium]